MYSVEELAELEDILLDTFDKNPLMPILSCLNRMEQLDPLLQTLQIPFFTESTSSSTNFSTGKILVFGESDIKPSNLKGLINSLELDFNRFEFHLKYEDIKSFNFQHLQYGTSYAAILIGPIPHSGKAKGDYGSIISALEQQDGYPPIIRLTDSNGLKITKKAFPMH